MDTADRDRSGRPAPATAGTLDAGDQAPGTAGDTAGQAADTPAGQPGSAPADEAADQPANAPAGAVADRPAGAAETRSRPPGSGPLWRRAARSPVTRHAVLLLCFIGAGVAV